MSDKPHLHIVSFDIPLPANYGGVIDVFHKLKALSRAGVSIKLHCFESSRQRQDALADYCTEVHYYKRRKNTALLFGIQPFIVRSRTSSELEDRLLSDSDPILVEGIHCSAFMNRPAFDGRKCIVRAHNVEHDYYNGLASVERRLSKHFYLRVEAFKLRRYEPVLRKATAIAAISPDDTAYFQTHYGKTFYLPAFHPFDQVTCRTGTGDFAFYHGNLSIGENNQAACFLVRDVFAGLPYPLVIAGSNPSDELQLLVSKTPNVRLLDGLSQEEIHEHVAAAAVNVLPTFQSTGIKLKLLASLFNGRHCLVNEPMVLNTGLESLCIIAKDAAAFKSELQAIFEGKLFGQQEI
ncbi:MAG: hypothetical protein RL021_2077, partial [Bacteroidota bacterium]